MGAVLYIVGGAGSGRNPAVRDFPLVNRVEDEEKTAHLVRVIRLVEETIAAGGTHLLVPREQADWLGDHPLVAAYFAEEHDLAEASAETGIVFSLRLPEPASLAVDDEARPRERTFDHEWYNPIMELHTLQARVIGQLEERLELLAEQNNDLLGMVKQQQRASKTHEQQLTQLAEQVTDQAARGELQLAQLAKQVTEQAARGEQQLAQLAERTAEQAVRSFVDRDLGDLDSGCADLINYALSHRGFAAQAGLWINHPVSIMHSENAVNIGAINERIIEFPYVLSALSVLPRESHILDFGADESTLALSLASLGHHVVALDQRAYRLTHPRIEVVVKRAEEWEGPSQPLDAIVSLSTLEHVGLGHYDPSRSKADLNLDRQIMERFRGWLRPNGLLILTAPFGPWRVDDFQRTYDSALLDALLEGWNVLHRVYGFTADLHCWDTLNDPPPLDALTDSAARAVVMLRATPAN